ncbi:hypothetical protein GCM10010187_49860 [Actinomadura coerulea]|nr:hypothetical protein GCM10010187_49860 [Actinomadura coerulea]
MRVRAHHQPEDQPGRGGDDQPEPAEKPSAHQSTLVPEASAERPLGLRPHESRNLSEIHVQSSGDTGPFKVHNRSPLPPRRREYDGAALPRGSAGAKYWGKVSL